MPDLKCYGCGTAIRSRRSTVLCPECLRLPPAVQQRIRSAKQRGIVWSLPASNVPTILSELCTYCGGDGGTLNRFDSTRGYEPGNVVPCCVTCNTWKGSLSVVDFTRHAQRILIRLGMPRE